MIGLPASTELNKRIPKQKFYENITLTPALKKFFVEQVKIIYWRNKIATSSVNLSAGASVTEVEVFEVRLNQPVLDESVLRQIDKEIPYHILFLLEYEGKHKAAIGYKEAAASGNNAFKVNRYYYTEWLPAEGLPVKLDGLSIDAVYENFFRQIAGNRLQAKPTESIKESVEKDEKRQQLKKQIDKLQNKIRKEKQLNKQMQMNAELKQFKKELEELN